MSDPDRLLDRSASPLTRRLLSAARSDEPADAVLERTLAAVGASAVVLTGAGASAAATGTAAAAASAATSSAKAATLLFVAKWLTLGALGGAITATAAYETRDALRAAPAPAAVARQGPKAPEPDSATRRQPNVPPAEPEPRVAEERPPLAAPRSQTAAARPSGSSLAAEVAALDTARQALAKGDTGRALALLDAHREQFPEAHLLPEALHIRMEALYARGDRAAAARIAERILAGFPRSPHAARARRVADEGRR